MMMGMMGMGRGRKGWLEAGEGTNENTVPAQLQSFLIQRQDSR